jgi:hypothetical protein
MKSKTIIPSIMIVFLSLVITSAPKAQSNDFSRTSESDTTLEIAIAYTTAYPGSEAWIEIMMRNPQTRVSGFTLLVQITNSQAMRFCQDDTAGCLVDVDGCSAGILGTPISHCSPGWAEITIEGDPGVYIPPNPNWDCLFRICTKTCCIPDSTTDRSGVFLIFPNLTSFIYDENGQPVPFRYNQGELLVWWSVPGDASGDSLVTSADVVFLINYLFRNGVLPCVCEAADCNYDCLIGSGDILYLLQYLFRGGDPPLPGCQWCVPCPHEDCWPE